MATFTTCGEDTRAGIEADVKKLVSLINDYRWIINAYVSDFYTFKYWEQLPKTLQGYFDTVDPPDLAWMLSNQQEGHVPTNRLAPLSLLALHCCIQTLSLRRSAVDLESTTTSACISSSLSTRTNSGHIVESDVAKICSSHVGPNASVQTTAMEMPNYKNGQCMDMKHIFRKHVKPKKQHEIDRLGQVIKLLCHQSGCDNVVDVGAGLGHLSRLLTFQHGLKVTTVEATDGHAPKAETFDRELKKDVQKAMVKKIKMSSNQATPCKCGQSEMPASNNRAQEEDIANQQLDNFPSNKEESPRFLCAYHQSANSVSNSNSTIVENDGHSPLIGGSVTREKFPTAEQSAEVDKTLVPGDGKHTLPNHVTCKVQPDIAASQFVHILNQQTSEDTHDDTPKNFVLAGLHACGDLTPTLLRVFANCPTAVGLASVACCYMKLISTVSESSSHAGRLQNYPMSSTLKYLPHHELTYEAREMACHFADAYQKRLMENSPHLKIHSYRAALQFLITSVNPDFKSGDVRLVSKKGSSGTFLQYAADNLKKVNMDINAASQDLLRHCDNMTQHWKRVVAFYTLRLSLAPVVEALILLDRALFLSDNGIRSLLVPIFDAGISPRNFALLAVKS